ncbi:MAG: ABC transporter permease [Polyangiales bacterium]
MNPLAWLGALRLALRALARNKLRAALTVLGILIGVAAVVAMTALGEGAKAKVTSQMQALGANMVVVFPGASQSSGAKGAAGSAASLTEDDLAAIGRECPSVGAVAAASGAAAQVVYEDQNYSTRVNGITADYLKVRAWNLERGSAWTEADDRTAARVCLVGKTVVSHLFGVVDPIDKVIRLGKMPCRVLGVLAEKGQSSFGSDQDDVVLVPMKTFTGRVSAKPRRSVDVILASATDATTTKRAEAQIRSLLMQRHHIGEMREPDFRVHNLQDVQQSLEAMQATLAALLLGIAAIALLVGGIGVMNIMLVSVAERTREIGIRMAIGAREGDILVQFLIEAVVLSLLGGAVGTMVGIGAIVGLAKALEWPMRMQPQALVVALAVSATIGVVFGFFPARRAARMDPIDALRRE